ncbi:hypothetical protein ACJX0J_030762, partial [Zea mays]
RDLSAVAPATRSSSSRPGRSSEVLSSGVVPRSIPNSHPPGSTCPEPCSAWLMVQKVVLSNQSQAQKWK